MVFGLGLVVFTLVDALGMLIQVDDLQRAYAHILGSLVQNRVLARGKMLDFVRRGHTFCLLLGRFFDFFVVEQPVKLVFTRHVANVTLKLHIIAETGMLQAGLDSRVAEHFQVNVVLLRGLGRQLTFVPAGIGERQLADFQVIARYFGVSTFFGRLFARRYLAELRINRVGIHLLYCGIS